MTACPTCGSTVVPCPCEMDSRIAAWIEAEAAGPTPLPAAPGPACPACGHSGEMADDLRGTFCPACDFVLPAPRAGLTPRVTQVVDCPECGRSIGVLLEDAGKTVVCPGCSYFLGTPIAKPGRGD